MKFRNYSQMNGLQYLRYIMLHPIDGYQELIFNKKASLKLSLGILASWFIIECLNKLCTNYIFNPLEVKNFNIYIVVFSTLILYLIAAMANWGFCTLMEGKGSFFKIFVCSSYALIPYLACKAAVIFLSQFLVKEEEVFLIYIMYLGIVWSMILLISCIQVIHDYTLPKTIGSMLLTVLGMLIILFIAVLLFSLFQQMWIFIYTVYIEITSRM